MFTNLNNIDIKNPEIRADLCVVGAGIAGIAFAREFANSRQKVVLLESGSLDLKGADQELNTGENVGRTYYKLDEARQRAFGGSSHLWHVDKEWQINSGIEVEEIVRLRGLDAIDFKKREWVPNSGWPFSKSHLDPYYSKAHKVFKIGPYRYDAEYWEEVMDVRKVPFRTNNVKTTVFQFARNNIFYSDYKEELKHSENITVILNATALNIQLNESARTTDAIEAVSVEGKKLRVNAKHFVLAQGGLETPRLMLLSDNVMSSGVGNQNDLVGRYFMEHPHLWSGTLIPSDQRFFHEKSMYGLMVHKNVPFMGKMIVSDSVMEDERIMNNSLNILHRIPMAALIKPSRAFHRLKKSVMELDISRESVQDLKTMVSNSGVVSYAALKKMTGGNHDKWYRKNKKYDGYRLNIMAEQTPDPESRVMLDDKRDQLGQQKIKLNWKLNSDDMRSIRRFLKVINRELKKDSLGEILSIPADDTIPDDLHGGYHHMGTTRMNNDPKQGVVDENCRVHGIENLYIAGSSVFPTSGYANPTLTIVALSLRLADHIKELSD